MTGIHRQRARRPVALRGAWLTGLGLVLLAGRAGADPAAARADFQSGLEAYAATNYAAAAEHFSAAAAVAPEAQLAARARFNAATALARLGELDAAETLFQQALETPDLEQQAAAYYNLATALANEPPPAEADAQDRAALEAYRERLLRALAALENAMLLDPDAPAPKRNYEITQERKTLVERLIEELPPPPPQPQQQQQDDKDQQDDDQQDEDQTDQTDQTDQSDPPDQPSPEEPEPTPEDEPEDEGADEAQADEPAGEPETEEVGLPETPADGEINPEDAERLLDRLRQQERERRAEFQPNLGPQRPVEKDW